MLAIFFALFFQCVLFSNAQTQTGKTNIKSESNSSKRYHSDLIIACINGYKTTINLLAILKPDEVTIDLINSSTNTSDTLLTKVTIQHLKNGTMLVFFNKKQDHVVVPDINTEEVSRLAHKTLPEHLLILHPCTKESIGYKPIKRTSSSLKINFFVLNDKLYTADVMRNLNSTEGNFTKKGFISGC